MKLLPAATVAAFEFNYLPGSRFVEVDSFLSGVGEVETKLLLVMSIEEFATPCFAFIINVPSTATSPKRWFLVPWLSTVLVEKLSLTRTPAEIWKQLGDDVKQAAAITPAEIVRLRAEAEIDQLRLRAEADVSKLQAAATVTPVTPVSPPASDQSVKTPDSALPQAAGPGQDGTSP